MTIPRNHARMTQELTRAALPPQGYQRPSARAAEKLKVPTDKPWRKVRSTPLKYVVLVINTKTAAVHVVGPYKYFKQAEVAAKGWTIEPWSASVEQLKGRTTFSLEEA